MKLFRTILPYILTAAVLFGCLMLLFAWPTVTLEVKYQLGSVSAPTVVASTQSHESQIIIPKIGVSAPILWDVPLASADNYLDQGVVGLAGSVKPGEAGNTVLYGHSSDYIWKKDPYATVFTLLPKLKNGDQITVVNDGSPFVYQVTKTFLVHPEQVEVAANTPTNQLTLITCYPIQTTLLRYVVQAEPVAGQ